MSSTSPTVSVIVPTFNHAHFLPHAVQSVLEQTFQDWEVVIVDDGSTDHTRDVVREFADARVRYIYQSNRGLAAARNTGLGASLGEYVALLDADDLYLPCKLRVQVDWLRSHGDHGFVAGGWNYIDEQGKLIGEYKPWLNPPLLDVKAWLYNCYVNPVSVLVSKRWVQDVGGFDENFRRVEDWDLWLRLAYAGCKMGWVNEIVSSYRISRDQMTKNAAAQKLAYIRMMDKFFSQAGLATELEALKPEVYGHVYLFGAGHEYAVGQYADAKESVAQAIKHDSKLLRKWEPEQVRMLLSWANSPGFEGDLIDCANRVFSHLPDEAAGARARKHWALGEIGLKTLFTAHQARDWRQVQRAALTVTLNAPHRMLSRGIWSILWQSLRQRTQVTKESV